ncbi:MAG: hypothetical protein IPL48_14070 [Bacteroidetes bacterium]|nr:hypothetical protein [Bacteroidota bacterium]
MALKIPVKAGAISNLTDARFFASYEVDMLGFCLDPQNENYISPQEAQAIKAWISGPKIVAEFANQDEENVLNIIDFLQVNVIQLSADYSEQFIQQLQQKGLQIILDISTATPDIILDVLQIENISYYIITETQFEEIKILQNKNVIVLIQSENHLNHYPAIQLNGFKEKSTGIKLFEFEGNVLDGILE